MDSLVDSLVTIGGYYSLLWDQIKDNNIFLFGASSGCYRFMDWVRKKDDGYPSKAIKGIFDNNSEKWGERIDDIVVLRPDSVLDENILSDDDIVVITSGSAHQIIPQLESYGVRRDKIVIFTISYSESFEEFPSYYRAHLREFQAVYDMLADEKSKQVFEKIVEFRLTANFDLLKDIYDEYNDQYFDKKIVTFSDKDVYVDCGAYTGDTFSSYLSHKGGEGYRHIISIEADPESYQTLLKKTAGKSGVTCVNKGVWSESGSLKFNHSKSGAANHISSEGNLVVDVDKIDNIVAEYGTVTHIKMDIEGSEMQALLGAHNTITRYKPSLAICVYHNVDDFVRIPLLIKSICPDYKLYFRQYQQMSAQETVCYAVIK